MPILKPSDWNSCGRKASSRQSVRLPWAIVVPNGLSVLARSTSTWIHWWSPETSANLLMSSWVSSRQSLGPMVWPMSPLSSSIPFTVVGVMARSISTAVVPGLRVECLAQRALPAPDQRLAMGGQHCVELELEQGLERRIEALAIEALDLGIDLVGCPHHEPAAGLGNGIAENERIVARKVERRLKATRLPDRVRGDATGERHAGVYVVEGGAVVEAFRAGGVAVDGGVGVSLVALPERLGAADVVRDRDENGDAFGDGFVDDGEHRGGVRRELRIDEQRRAIVCLRRVARDLRAEFAGMP